MNKKKPDFKFFLYDSNIKTCKHNITEELLLKFPERFQ